MMIVQVNSIKTKVPIISQKSSFQTETDSLQMKNSLRIPYIVHVFKINSSFKIFTFTKIGSKSLTKIGENYSKISIIKWLKKLTLFLCKKLGIILLESVEKEKLEILKKEQ